MRTKREGAGKGEHRAPGGNIIDASPREPAVRKLSNSPKRVPSGSTRSASADVGGGGEIDLPSSTSQLNHANPVNAPVQTESGMSCRIWTLQVASTV